MDLKAPNSAAHCVAGRPRLEQSAPRGDEAQFARAGAGGNDERSRRGGRGSERVALGALQDGLHGGQTEERAVIRDMRYEIKINVKLKRGLKFKVVV